MTFDRSHGSQRVACGSCAAEMELINQSTLVARWRAFQREVVSILRSWRR